MIADRMSPVRIPRKRRGMDRYIYTMTLKNSLQSLQRIASILHDVDEVELLPPRNLFNLPIAKVKDDGGRLKDTVGILVVLVVSMGGRRVKDQDESITRRVSDTVVLRTTIIGAGPVSNEIHLVLSLGTSNANNDGHHAVGVTVLTAAVPFSIICDSAGISSERNRRYTKTINGTPHNPN